MTSLDDLFRSTASRAGTWRPDDVHAVLEALAGHELRADWEPGDEEWGRVVDGSGNLHAMVCARVPVCIGLGDVETARLGRAVSWLTVASMSDRVFEVDRQLLEEIFERRLSDNINYSKLSINDLWWATVT